MTHNIEDILRKRIANLIEESNFTQKEIAAKLKIDNSALSRILKGTRKISSDELNKLSDIFNVSTDYLLGKSSIKTSDGNNKVVDLEDEHTIMMFEGKPIPQEDMDLIKRLLRGKE